MGESTEPKYDVDVGGGNCTEEAHVDPTASATPIVNDGVVQDKTTAVPASVSVFVETVPE